MKITEKPLTMIPALVAVGGLVASAAVVNYRVGESEKNQTRIDNHCAAEVNNLTLRVDSQADKNAEVRERLVRIEEKLNYITGIVTVSKH